VRAIVVRERGGPEVLRLEDVADPVAGASEVVIRVQAAGVQLIEGRMLSGRPGPYPPPELPTTPGREVAGVVDEVGPDVDAAWLGRPVAAYLGAAGGYAARAVAPVAALRPIPDGVDPDQAVAMVATGRTAMAIVDLAQITADDVVAITAAAGGIGSLAVQVAHHAGATVVGLAGGAAKVDLARGLGADVAIDYLDPGWPGAVRAVLGERRVTAALDGVGGAVAADLLNLVAPGGRMVLFGFAAGPMPLTSGDLFRTGVTLSAAVGARAAAQPESVQRAYGDQAMAALGQGRIRAVINPPFALTDAADAHRALEGRHTSGKVVLVP
jgi:NADPH:quinone reductase